ncbi:MAG: dynamin family protein [Acidimicrobiales bacterium]
MTTGPTPKRSQTQSASNADVIAALRYSREACETYGREDIARRLTDLLQAVESPDVRVVVVGEFKQGKSSLINALVRETICPVDDDIATAVATAIRYGPEFRASAVIQPADDSASEPETIEIDRSDIRLYTTELARSRPEITVRGVEVELDRPLLKEGLMIVDTPGVGGLGSAHSTAALGALSLADAVLFVTDASQELTRTELDFLRQARDLCPNIVLLLSKIDFYPAWRKVEDLNKGHLQRAGIELRIIPVSSALRDFAVKRNDKALNNESGFPVLINIIKNELIDAAGLADRHRASKEITAVGEQLAAQFLSEKQALEDPEAAAAVIRELTEAKEKLDELQSRASRWSTTLSDGFADLSSNVEFDFRARMKTVVTEVDAALEQVDPLDTWAEMMPWLVNRVSGEVVANYRYLTEQSAALGADIGSHFDFAGEKAFESLEIDNPLKVLGNIAPSNDIDLKQTTVAAKGLTLLRSSYSGVLMCTMIGGMVAVPMVTPFALGAGLLLGRKGVKDEAARLVAQRRAQARQAARKYCDDVTFMVNKDSRDTLRRIQRSLRDFYSERTKELQRSTAEARKAAALAEKITTTERANRLHVIDNELKRIATLRTRAAQLVEGRS